MIQNAIDRGHIFEFVLADAWHGSSDNFIFINIKLKKKFISCLKSDRLIELSHKDKLEGKWESIDSIDLEKNLLKC